VSHSKINRKPKLHKGPKAACPVCSPETAAAIIAQLERLKKRSQR
jgi:hypothetical protein